MAETSIQITQGAGTNIDVANPGAGSTYRQIVALGDPNATLAAAIANVSGGALSVGATLYGAVTVSLPGTLPVSFGSGATVTALQGTSPWLANASIVGTVPVVQAAGSTLTAYQGGSPWLTNASIVGTPGVNASIQGTVPVSGTFWQNTQPVSGTFWQSNQPVTASISGTVPVSGTFWQATQPVSGTVNVVEASGATINVYQQGIWSVTLAGNVSIGALSVTTTSSPTVTALQGNGPWTANVSLVGAQFDGSGNLKTLVEGTMFTYTSLAGNVTMTAFQGGAPWSVNIADSGGVSLSSSTNALWVDVRNNLTVNAHNVSLTGSISNLPAAGATLTAYQGGSPWLANVSVAGVTTAAALADATANPTAGGLQVFPMGHNDNTGNWDRIRGLWPGQDGNQPQTGFSTTPQPLVYNGSTWDRIRSIATGIQGVGVNDGTNTANVVAGDTGYNGVATNNSQKVISFTTSSSGAQTLLANTDVRGYASLMLVFTSVGSGLALTGQFAPNSGGTYSTANNGLWFNASGNSTGLSLATAVLNQLPVFGPYFQLNVTALTSGTLSGYVILSTRPAPQTAALPTGTYSVNSYSSTGSGVPGNAFYLGANKGGNLTGLSLDGGGNLNVNLSASGTQVNVLASLAGNATLTAFQGGTWTTGLAANSTITAYQAGTWTVQPGNTANTTPWLATQSPATSGGLSFYSGSITTTVTSVKSSAGQIYGYHIGNSNTSAVYVQIFNKATGSVTLGTTAPDMALYIPASGGATFNSDSGIAMGTAISVACTTTRTGSTAPSNSVDLNFFYK